jgi:hypothetical protein
MIAAIYARPVTGRRLLLALLCLLGLAASAHADSAWVLWARTCDLKSERSGDYQRRQTYEAERWCKAAWTARVNEALTPEGTQAAVTKGTVTEYQCLLDTIDLAGPKGK